MNETKSLKCQEAEPNSWQPCPLKQAGASPWEFEPTLPRSPGHPAKPGQRPSFSPLLRTAFPRQVQRRIRGAGQAPPREATRPPPSSVSGHTPNQCTSINTVVLNRSPVMLRVDTGSAQAASLWTASGRSVRRNHRADRMDRTLRTDEDSKIHGGEGTCPRSFSE